MPTDYWIGTTDTAWNVAANWNSGSVPATTGETIHFDGRTTKSIAGYDASSTTLDALNHYRDAAYDIGSATSPLIVGATTCQIGLPGNTSGGGEVHLDFSTIEGDVTVYASPTLGTSGFQPVTLKANNVNSTATVHGGVVGIATGTPGDTSTIGSLYIGGGAVEVGAGVTLTTTIVSGGTATMRAGATNITAQGGTLTVDTDDAITTLNVEAEVLLISAGVITTVNVGNGGTLDATWIRSAVTITNCNVGGSGRIIDPFGRLTFTNAINIRDGANSSNLYVANRSVQFS